MYGERRPILIDTLFEDANEFRNRYLRFERISDSAIAEGYVNSIKGKIYVIAHACPLRDSDGGVIGAVETFRDITEHKLLEDAFRKSEEEYRTIVHHLTEAVVRFEPNGTITFVNNVFTDLMGFSEYGLIGKSIFDFMSERVRDEIRDQLTRFDKGVLENLNRIKGPDGRDRWILWKGRAIMGDDGRPREFIAAGRDITEIKDLQEKLLKERSKAEAYFDTAGTIMLVLDQAGSIKRVNKKGRLFLGNGPEDGIGRNWFESFVPERQREYAKKLFSEMLLGKAEADRCSFETTVQLPNTKERYVIWHYAVLRGEEGEPSEVILSGIDITDRIEMELQLRQYSSKLERLVEDEERKL